MVNISSTFLVERCEGKCELCSDTNGLSDYIVAPKTGSDNDEIVVVCEHCKDQLNSGDFNSNHWRCLNESMWSNVPAVQVLSYRMLNKLSHENWAADLLATMYLDDDLMEWATYDDAGNIHKDSNGQVLQKGDSVILIKDLDVKGANFSAKRGTVVKNIHLVEDNAGQIEGKVNDQQIVILTQFVRKA